MKSAGKRDPAHGFYRCYSGHYVCVNVMEYSFFPMLINYSALLEKNKPAQLTTEQ